MGMKCIDADKIARDLFIQKSQEWGSRFIHSLGHGVGIDIHENPYLSPISEEKIEENMVFTVEPGLYIPGLGGARTEDLLVIQKDGIKPLTHAEKFYY
jgi:Xaa-Pro aminopeptidase